MASSLGGPLAVVAVTSLGAAFTKLALGGPMVVDDSKLAGDTTGGTGLRTTNTKTVILGSLFRRRVVVRTSHLEGPSCCPRKDSCLTRCVHGRGLTRCLRLVGRDGGMYAVPIVTDVGYCASTR